jgi:hypothetical protein
VQEPLEHRNSSITRFARRANSSQSDRDHAGSPTKNPLRQNADLSSRSRLIGSSSPPRQIFVFRFSEIYVILSRSRLDERGVRPIVTKREAGMRWTLSGT